MDFGMAVRSATDRGTQLRYFQAVGKDNYRAPECYVPPEPEVDVWTPPGAEPGQVLCLVAHGAYLCEVRLPENAVPDTLCQAVVWGYAAAPADIWSTAVCTSTLLLGGPAWEA